LVKGIKKIFTVFLVWILATALLSGCLISDLEYWNDLYREQENRRIEEKNEIAILSVLLYLYIQDKIERTDEQEIDQDKVEETDISENTEISEEEAFNETFNMFFHNTGSFGDSGSDAGGNYVDLTIVDDPVSDYEPALVQDDTAAGDEEQETSETEQEESAVIETDETTQEDTVETGEAEEAGSDSKIEDYKEQGVITYRGTIRDLEITLHIDFDTGDCHGLITFQDEYGFGSLNMPLVGSVDLVTKELSAHSEGGTITFYDGSTESAGYLEITGKLIKLDTRIEGYAYNIEDGSVEKFYADSVLK